MLFPIAILFSIFRRRAFSGASNFTQHATILLPIILLREES